MSFDIEKTLLENGWQETWASQKPPKAWQEIYQYKNMQRGWYGCIAQSPDVCFTKGNKAIMFSLQGMFVDITAFQYKLYNNEVLAALSSVSVKAVILSQNRHILYCNYNGILPDIEVLKQFITDTHYTLPVIAFNPFLPAVT